MSMGPHPAWDENVHKRRCYPYKFTGKQIYNSAPPGTVLSSPNASVIPQGHLPGLSEPAPQGCWPDRPTGRRTRQGHRAASWSTAQSASTLAYTITSQLSVHSPLLKLVFVSSFGWFINCFPCKWWQMCSTCLLGVYVQFYYVLAIHIYQLTSTDFHFLLFLKGGLLKWGF